MAKYAEEYSRAKAKLDKVLWTPETQEWLMILGNETFLGGRNWNLIHVLFCTAGKWATADPLSRLIPFIHTVTNDESHEGEIETEMLMGDFQCGSDWTKYIHRNLKLSLMDEKSEYPVLRAQTILVSATNRAETELRCSRVIMEPPASSWIPLHKPDLSMHVPLWQVKCTSSCLSAGRAYSDVKYNGTRTKSSVSRPVSLEQCGIR